MAQNDESCKVNSRVSFVPNPDSYLIFAFYNTFFKVEIDTVFILFL
jgi:hypothetical protein